MGFIPVFYYPAHAWAALLRTIFLIGGIDITTEANKNKYGPHIIARMPQEMTRLLPQETDLESLLAFLEEFDPPRTTLKEIASTINDLQPPSM